MHLIKVDTSQLLQSYKNKLACSLVAGTGLHYGIRLDKGIQILNHSAGLHSSILGTNFDLNRLHKITVALLSLLPYGRARSYTRASTERLGFYVPSQGSQAEKLASFSVCATQRSLAWPGRPSGGALGRPTKHVRKHRGQTRVASMYSPCLGLGAFGTTLAF